MVQGIHFEQKGSPGTRDGVGFGVGDDYENEETEEHIGSLRILISWVRNLDAVVKSQKDD